MACDPVLGKFSKSTALEPCPAHSLLKLCLDVRLLFQNDPQASTAQVGFVVSFQRPLSLMENEVKGRTWPNPTVRTHENMKNTLGFFYPQMKTCSATKSMPCNKTCSTTKSMSCNKTCSTKQKHFIVLQQKLKLPENSRAVESGSHSGTYRSWSKKEHDNSSDRSSDRSSGPLQP